MRALFFGVFIRAPDFWKLPFFTWTCRLVLETRRAGDSSAGEPGESRNPARAVVKTPCQGNVSFRFPSRSYYERTTTVTGLYAYKDC